MIIETKQGPARIDFPLPPGSICRKLALQMMGEKTLMREVAKMQSISKPKATAASSLSTAIIPTASTSSITSSSEKKADKKNQVAFCMVGCTD